MTDNRNTILAVILSGIVLIAWQYFYNMPQMERQRLQSQQQAELAKKSSAQPDAGASSPPRPNGATAPSAPAGTAPVASGVVVTRDGAIAASPRVKIETPRISGSIALKGARIDDISLVQFRDTVEPTSPSIVLFSPSDTAEPYYAEFGWSSAAGANMKVPDQSTVWQQEGSNALTPTTPVKLAYDNGQGLVFHRTIGIDDHYLFTIKDDVSNSSGAPVTLYPYGLISRGGTPPVSGYAILHEGFIGYLGEHGLH